MNLDKFFSTLRDTELRKWEDHFRSVIDKKLRAPEIQLRLKQWNETIDSLSDIAISKQVLDHDIISVYPRTSLSSEELKEISGKFHVFDPWRKGPFDICGVHIDSEWRSNMKWDRLTPHIKSFKDKLVLDVGSGNGYHCLRALGSGARFVMGIDSYVLFFAQNQTLLKYFDVSNSAVLPIRIEEMPDDCKVFDIVFSMGVLYHIKDQREHILKLKSLLREEGELVLETLIIDEKYGEVLIPRDKYASMKKVFAIPSVKTVIAMLKDCGFRDIRCVDQTETTSEEQRTTFWACDPSLKDSLDKKDHSNTIEGYPAPIRGMFLAKA
jgi:tRNA (mo5U34)-methyltransferase